MIKLSLKRYNFLFIICLLAFSLSCNHTIKPKNKSEKDKDTFINKEETIVDIDGDNIQDYVFSGYEGRGCHFLAIELSSDSQKTYTDYEISLGYPYEEDSSVYWNEKIKIKDFDNDGKFEVFAEIFTCCNGFPCWDKIPNELQEKGITTNFIIIEYQDNKLITKSIPFSISPEQYFYSQTIDWEQDLILKEENGKYGYVDKSNTWIILPELEKGLEFAGKITGAYWKGQEILINKKGEIVDDFGVFSAASQNNVAFYDDKFDKNGLLLAGADGSMFFLNTLGKVFKDKYFCDLGFFSDELAMAQKECDSKIGYIDKNLNWVIFPKFDSAFRFDKGKAIVEFQGKKYYVYKDGHLEKRE